MPTSASEPNIEPNAKSDTISQWLAGFVPDADSAAPIDAQRAVHLARRLQQRANELQTAQERRQQAELDRMIQHPGDKATRIENSVENVLTDGLRTAYLLVERTGGENVMPVSATEIGDAILAALDDSL